ncbi:DUF1206 domain-containing protein [Rugosimonospora africana]|uniref:DUF1206 domain-containing protein n=1 Tax=Rugosimonospora africana TaxID=556532 RepID=A0A8J3VPX7_9ACTN|nr:DUF1206 domain-containing protein [Rugosimonospora africana]GIH13768.1 hypothetical protein Raf01_19400 [Rugosimonospora africana]
MSTLAQSARGTAGKARNSTIVHALARGGFVGYGILHLVVAWLALQIALGHSSNETDQSGAFQLLVREPFGRPLVWIIVVGLAGMALWQVLAAITGYESEQGKRKVFERIGAAGRAVIYAALAVDAGKVAAGNPTSSAGEQRQTTAGVLAHTSGRVLVAIAGVAVLAGGIGLIVFGAKRAFAKRLHTERMGPGTRKATTALGMIGYLAKGAGYGIAGGLLFVAAVHRDPKKSGGLDAALHTLAGKPYGQVLLIVIAAGFAAFGLYCFFQSRYRDV